MVTEQGPPSDVTGPETPVWRLMTRAVATISADARIDELARKLSAVEAGAMGVGSAGTLTGVVSERDVTRALGGSRGIAELTVGDIASTTIIWCSGQAGAASAARLLVEAGVRHLIVGDADTGEVEGIVSARDLIATLIGP